MSSFIKISVSGTGERALGREVDRLLGNHLPLMPSGAASSLPPFTNHQKPREVENNQGLERWERIVLRGVRVGYVQIRHIWKFRNLGF